MVELWRFALLVASLELPPRHAPGPSSRILPWRRCRRRLEYVAARVGVTFTTADPEATVVDVHAIVHVIRVKSLALNRIPARAAFADHLLAALNDPLHGLLHGFLCLPPLHRATAYLPDLLVDVCQHCVASNVPSVYLIEDTLGRARWNVAQRRNRGDVHRRCRRRQLGRNEADVGSADNEIFKGSIGRYTESCLERFVSEVRDVPAQGHEGEKPELVLLLVVELW